MDQEKAPETPHSAENDIWGNPAHQEVSQPQPVLSHPPVLMAPRKRRWGFTEIILSFVALICVQVAMLIVMTAGLTKDLVERGADIDDVDAVTAEVTREIMKGGNLVLIMLSMYIIWIAFMAYATYFKGHRSFAKDFWLKFRWVNDISIGLGLAVLLRGLEIGILSGLQALGVNLEGAENTTNIINQDGAWYFIIAILFASVVGPICEEFFFRGFLLQAFIRNFRRGNISGPRSILGYTVLENAAPLFNAYVKFRNWTFRHKYVLAAIFSGIIFGSVHWSGLATLPGFVPVIETGLIGILFAFIVIKTRRLGIVIFAHCFFNLSGVLLATIMQ